MCALMGSLSAARAQSTLTAWTFDNLSIGINGSPNPSTGLGSASALGMNNSYNNTNSVSNPDVQSLAGSSSGGPNCWRIRGYTVSGTHGNGWSSSAPIGSQGAQFNASTYGYYKIKASFDVYPTTDGEANLQVQYSTDGNTWINANIISAASGTIVTNTSSANTVQGTYIQLVGGAWNDQITIDLTGISGVDNDIKFAIRLVNASTGADCLDTTGAPYNNTSGNWSFDNVVIVGQSIDVVANWNYDIYGTKKAPFNTPAPTTGSGTSKSIGMINGYTNQDGTVGSSNWCDITQQGGSSTGPNSYCWRVRGGLTAAGATGSGWNSAAPVGSQGAEWDVDTSGYTNVICSFDVYFTTQAPDKIAVVYTTDGWTTTNIANSFYYGANPAWMFTNSSDPNLFDGPYFYENFGQGWYNTFVVDLTGVPATANNTRFAFRVIEAGTGPQMQNYLGQPYNNQSGNMRFANVTVGGTAGTPPPIVSPDPNATVDNPFTNTFTETIAWRTNIFAIYINGLLLTNKAYTTTNAGKIILDPSKSTLLQASGLLNISVLAHGYGTARIAQQLAPGVATKLAVNTQTAGPTASGGTLTGNPVYIVADKYGNGSTNPYPNVTMTAAVGDVGDWTLSGAATQTSSNGVIAFTNLAATLTGSTPITSAYINFTVTGYGATFHTNSPNFTIGAAPVPFTPGNLAVFQVDTASNNTTFSIIEVNPATANQAAPVNIMPISATGPNPLREAPAATTGRLALSDDGTLVVFGAFADGSAATPDETYNLNRAVAAVSSTNVLDLLGYYTSQVQSGSEARAACVLGDDFNYIVDDKGGLYQANSNSTPTSPNLNAYNNVVVKTFGGTPWVETQKAVFGQNIPVVYKLGLDPDNGYYDVTFPNNLVTDQYASDFYLISTNGGVTYDILYIVDQVANTTGVINKFSLTSRSPDVWAANGSFTNGTGVDGLFATTNGDGGVNLFYTTGGGGSPGNSLVRVVDTAGWNQNINIGSSNVLYTVTNSASLKGITFVPQSVSNAVQLIPPPVLNPQNPAGVGATITLTNTPNDPAWHSAITGITINGVTPPSGAYDITQSGGITIDPSKYAPLQTPGNFTVAVTATGYSTDVVSFVQLSGPAAQLTITRDPGAPIGSGGPLVPVATVTATDTYGYTVSNANITAAPAGPLPLTWTLGGPTTQVSIGGVATFSNLTAFSTGAVAGATVSFSVGSLSVTSTPAFNIPAPIQSVLSNATVSGNKFTFSFTNAPSLSFSVVGTNNIAAPLSNWPAVGTTVENPAGSGQYFFTNSGATNPLQFYILRQP